MAKLDKFLAQMLAKGAATLHLDPGQLPTMELPGGHRVTLSTQELVGAVLDGLAKEILPDEHSTSYLRGEQIRFPYTYENEPFQFLLQRSTVGTRIVAGRVRALTADAIPAPSEASSGDFLIPKGPPPAKVLGMDSLINWMLDLGGSDVYLNAGEAPLLRHQGRVGSVEGFKPIPAKDLADLLKTITPQASWEAFERGLDTEFAYTDETRHCRLRASLFHDALGPALALRIMPKEVPDADTLGLSEPVRRLVQFNHGLVVIAGPSGSGRTTTVSALVAMAHESRHGFIVTIEDAIEFPFLKGNALVRQREVGRDLARQKQAIRAALRQAPDILVVGELRDAETVELALDAAGAGRLVLAMLSATSALDAISRLSEVFGPDHQPSIRGRLAGSLKAVLCQTLLTKNGGGQVAAIETIFNNPHIADLIRKDEIQEIPAAMKTGRQYGQMLQNDVLVKLIKDKIIEPMEAYRKCHDRETFIQACKKAGLAFDPRKDGEEKAGG
ncbi:MAG: Flp pilus assembly complex ATPase component TadA [Acidobacteriota bacterium]|nr:Flp pilus assembly complex ATPase component TadA [Acidobacteriota bacterium]